MAGLPRAHHTPNFSRCCRSSIDHLRVPTIFTRYLSRLSNSLDRAKRLCRKTRLLVTSSLRRKCAFPNIYRNREFAQMWIIWMSWGSRSHSTLISFEHPDCRRIEERMSPISPDVYPGSPHSVRIEKVWPIIKTSPSLPSSLSSSHRPNCVHRLFNERSWPASKLAFAN